MKCGSLTGTTSRGHIVKMMTFTNCIAQVTLKHIRDATLPNSWASLFHRGQPFQVTRSGAEGAAEATTQKLKKIVAIYDQPDFVAAVESFLGISWDGEC